MGKKVSKFSITKMKGESKISEENALDLVLKACLKFDIDVDAETDDKSRKNKENILSAFQDFIMRGILSINTDTWEMTHILQEDYSKDLKQLVYKPVSAKMKRSMDGKDDNEQFEKLYEVLAASSNQALYIIDGLIGIDLKVAEAVASFFL